MCSMGARKIMARYNEKQIPYAVQEQLVNAFCKMLADLKTPLAVHDFLKDLLNRQERMMLIRRLLIAKLLTDGFTYRAICDKMKCGNSTIARVERWLRFGRGGYEKALKLLKIKV